MVLFAVCCFLFLEPCNSVETLTIIFLTFNTVCYFLILIGNLLDFANLNVFPGRRHLWKGQTEVGENIDKLANNGRYVIGHINQCFLSGVITLVVSATGLVSIVS